MESGVNNMEYKKNLTTEQLQVSMAKFYGFGEELKYVLGTIDNCVKHNWTRMQNVCPEGRNGVATDIGFVFEYIGNNMFACSTIHKELL